MASGGLNRLLCDVPTTPDGSVLTIGDAGAQGVHGIYVCDRPEMDVVMGTSQRALWVRTMGMHECSVYGELVRVRVFDGADRRGLGTLVFDGRLKVDSGILAIGDSRSPDRHLLFGPSSSVRISVFVHYAVEVLHLEDPAIGYPVSGPSHVNVLLQSDSGFAPAVAEVASPWWCRFDVRRLSAWVRGTRRTSRPCSP